MYEANGTILTSDGVMHTTSGASFEIGSPEFYEWEKNSTPFKFIGDIDGEMYWMGVSRNGDGRYKGQRSMLGRTVAKYVGYPLTMERLNKALRNMWNEKLEKEKTTNKSCGFSLKHFEMSLEKAGL